VWAKSFESVVGRSTLIASGVVMAQEKAVGICYTFAGCCVVGKHGAAP
jgi:hypothetical protein